MDVVNYKYNSKTPSDNVGNSTSKSLLKTKTSRACRYLKDGEKFLNYLNVLLERLEKAASTSRGVTENTIIVKGNVRHNPLEVKTINLKPEERQQIDSRFVELIDVAKRKVAHVKELMVFDGNSSATPVVAGSSSSTDQPEDPPLKDDFERLYDDGWPLLDSAQELLLRQRLNSYQKLLNENNNQISYISASKFEPIPSTSKVADFVGPVDYNQHQQILAPLPPNATPRQIFALLLSLEEEHFRAARFEAAVQSASDTLSVLTGGIYIGNGGNFSIITSTIIDELKDYRRVLDDRQIADIISAFNAAFTGLKETVPTFSAANAGKLSRTIEPPEIVDYLVALSALLTATRRLRPAASEVLVSLFTSSVDEMVKYTAGQLTLLASGLLAPSSTTLQSKHPLEQQDHHAYRCFVDGALLLLKRLLSNRYIADLGAKVGVEALSSLLTSFLPFYVLRMRACQRHTGLYQPIEAFAEGRLFFGFSDKETASWLLESKVAKNSTLVVKDDSMTKMEKKKKTKKVSQEPRKLTSGPPVNCIALLTALLRLLVRLTTQPMVVIAEVLMVPPSCAATSENSDSDEGNNNKNSGFFNANFNLRNIEEARIMAKTLLWTFWDKTSHLLAQMEKCLMVSGRRVSAPSSLPQVSAFDRLRNQPAFTATLEELLQQLHILFECYSDPPNTKHLDEKIVTLGNDTAGKALNYLAANLGSSIWKYFHLVDEEMALMASKSGALGNNGGFSVMIAYLSSLSLDRPVALEKEEEAVVNGENDEEEEDCGNDVEFVNASFNEPENDTKVLAVDDIKQVAEPSSSQVHFQLSTEQALASFSFSMLKMASQMLNTVEVFVKDIAQIEASLKKERLLAVSSTFTAASKEASEPMSVDKSAENSKMITSKSQSLPFSSTAFVVDDKIPIEQLSTNSNDKRSREDAEKEMQLQQQTESTKVLKRAIEIISIDSGDDETKTTHTVSTSFKDKKPPSLLLPLSSKKARFSDGSETASTGPSTSTGLTTTVTRVKTDDKADNAAVDDSVAGDLTDAASTEVLNELKVMRQQVASYEQTIDLLLKKIEKQEYERFKQALYHN